MAGRPTAYRKEYAIQAQNYALLGATDREIAAFFGVSVKTLRAWKKAFPAFAEALKHGKKHADAQMIGAAFRNGLAGNAKIQVFWLKNRLGWRDKVDIDANVTGKIESITRRVVDPVKDPE